MPWSHWRELKGRATQGQGQKGLGSALLLADPESGASCSPGLPRTLLLHHGTPCPSKVQAAGSCRDSQGMQVREDPWRCHQGVSGMVCTGGLKPGQGPRVAGGRMG